MRSGASVPDDVPRLARLQAQLLDAVVSRPRTRWRARLLGVHVSPRAEGRIRSPPSRLGTDLRLVFGASTWPPDADAFYLARLERPLPA